MKPPGFNRAASWAAIFCGTIGLFLISRRVSCALNRWKQIPIQRAARLKSESSITFMKPSTYLETSIIGAYLDNGEPFRRDLTIRWWEHELSEYRAVISPLVVSELERLTEPHRSAYLKLVKGLEQVELTEEVAILAEGYVSRGIFHRKYIADALHVAVASFHKIDYLVTWNFGHLANVRRQARIRLFNTAAGFFVPMIVTPEFLVSEATEVESRKPVI